RRPRSGRRGRGNVRPGPVALMVHADRVKKDRLVLAKIPEGGLDDITRAHQPSLGMADPASHLPARAVEPRIEQVEVLAAVVDLLVRMPDETAVAEHGHILRTAIADPRHRLREVNRRV